MMILPPIIISVVVSKFFTESIRFETFDVISVVVFVVLSLLLLLLSGVRQYLGAPCELMALARIGRGKLSLCFKRNGNIFLLPRRSSQGLFGVVGDCSGVVRSCSGLFGDFRGLTNDLTLMTKNLFHMIFKNF